MFHSGTDGDMFFFPNIFLKLFKFFFLTLCPPLTLLENSYSKDHDKSNAVQSYV